MARKAIYGHATYVDPTTYPDDGSSPVGTTEWNLPPDQAGMIGNTPATTSIAVASGALLVTDSVCVVTGEGGGADDIDTITITNTNEYDFLYLFGQSGYNVTLKHTASPSTSGQVKTISGVDEVLSATVPTILIRKGNFWYGYGGGTVSTPTDITVADTTDTTCFPALFESATGDLAPKTDAGITYNAGTGILTSTGFAGPITGNVTGNASGSSATCSGLSATATALATARTIGGTSFDGTANIAVALSATTTALATARTIGGTSFDGTADIAVGLSATSTEATNVTAVANNSTDETVYPTFVDGATGTQGLETDTGLNYNPSTGLLSAVGLTLSGDLTVNGTNTIINSTTLTVDDKNIEMGSVATPSDTTADGGGITLKGATDKTILWDNANDNFTSSEHVNIASGKKFKINNVDTLTATGLGSNVVSSSLTSVGTLASPVLTTPNIGTPSAGVLTNCTALPASQVAQGTMVSGMVLVAPALGTPASGVATNLSGTASNLTSGNVTTNANLTGDVTSSGNATTIATDAVDIAMLSASGTAGSATFLRGDNTWASAGGAIEDYVSFDNTAVTTYTGNSTTFVTSGVATRDIYIKKIDANNEGVFTKIFKNGSAVEVQIA